jgi:hypothetical protein
MLVEDRPPICDNVFIRYRRDYLIAPRKGTGLTQSFRTFALLGFVLVLGGCAYTARRQWVKRPEISLSQAKPFREAITECVTKYDPDHLSQLANAGDYRIWGWFVPEERTDAVKRCMWFDGWDVALSTVLAP